ncbi:hypothetical protein [Tunturibacter empetritectus]|uniref:Lipoprotein n=1 Tax=Tunturiibacter empetritectus TaxID=3069691 RepID=A0A7W8IIY1_9BACT|nr:hypothetical protein [Edaphobacter lichenicola]MBB5317301.1 hypothetical protein [Edaphobacter lichenicola]
MRRSTQVAAPLLAAAALSMLTGCQKPEMQRCVDENNHVVDDSLCANLPANQQGAQQRPDGHGSFLPVIIPYRYYYGGWGDYGLGSVAGGGGYAPVSGRSYANRSGVTIRGGFGSSFHGEGGEGSGAHGGASAGE